MELKLSLLLFVFLFSSVCGTEKSMLVEGEGDDNVKENIRNLLLKMNGGNFKDKDISDDDDDDESGGWSGSGSGSGIEPTFEPKTTKEKHDKTKSKPTIVDITIVSSTAKSTTDLPNCVDCTDDETTTMEPREPNNNELGVDHHDDDDDDDDDDNNQGEKEKKKGGVNFTTGIIIGVVVGAVLAIMIIVFLVYRLRKKDEGSYSLDEQSSTAYLRGDTDNPKNNKEYFA